MFERSWKLGEGAEVSSANLNRLTHYMYITIVHHEKIVLVRSVSHLESGYYSN